jgi:outer membrane protein assembly factor BamD
MRITLLSIFLFSFVAIGCNNDQYVKPTDPVDVAFGKALEFYENEDYNDATDAFEVVVNLARGTNYAKDAQFYLAESYFKNGQYLIAASEYRRFYANYPRDEKRPEMQYKEAFSHFKMSPRYKLDQSNSKKALELFQLFILRYPNSDFAVEAGEKIDVLRNKLAEKKFNAADFYLTNSQYEAAALYYGMVVNEFPESKFAEPSLFMQINSYLQYAENSITQRQKERYQMALDSYQKYLQLFPNGENRSEVENLFDEIQNNLDKLASN